MKFFIFILSLCFIPLLGFADSKPPKGFTAYVYFPGYLSAQTTGKPDPYHAGVSPTIGPTCKSGDAKVYTTTLTTDTSISGFQVTWTYSGTAKPGYCTPGLENLTYEGYNSPTGDTVSVMYSYGNGAGYIMWSAQLSAQNPSYSTCCINPPNCLTPSNAARFFTCMTDSSRGR